MQAFLYADPAAHSLSPAMFRAAFAWAGLPGHYQAVRVAAADLPAALARLKQPGVIGANLSLPHKQAAMPMLDSLSPQAQRIGAVNTVVAQGGMLSGHNTDAPGLLAALRGLDLPSGVVAVVLGAGGAARAAVEALSTGGQVYVVNRTPERAEALALSWPQARALAAAEVPWEEVGLVVNASSAGLNAPEQTPLAPQWLARLPRGAGVYDMVYAPRQTRLLRDAAALGLRTGGGLSMLAEQAALGFALMTGVTPPAALLLSAAEAA